ncbi:Isoflavone reductase-like IRL [Pseudocercospora fuligena]|uniref:Isoflavone reductase-like IRL n=1 Tax=Pseudocercospora fuligena TaxID=685502 RepID=A0A8H6VGA9_9PEZI|nr:Isoflavone reductase-like IRL [Pseudocercospora fuligena]
MSIKSVVLLGADGKLGPSVLRSLVENGFNVTVMKRKSSKSQTSYPNQVLVSDDFEVEELAGVLSGKDAVVVTIKGSETALQKRIADACIKAGVKRFIPADFGSVDSSSSLTKELVPLYRHKTELREYLIELASKHPDFTWTSLVCGHFFDWSLEFLHIWLKERKMEVLDDGEAKWSASTLSQIGEATARILQRPDVTKNRMIYVQSFLVSQNEVLASFEHATGQKWTVQRHDSKQYQAEEKKKADSGDLEAVENLVWLLGAIDANWELRKDFAMQDLGLKNEDLDEVVSNVVKAFDQA